MYDEYMGNQCHPQLWLLTMKYTFLKNKHIDKKIKPNVTLIG